MSARTKQLEKNISKYYLLRCFFKRMVWPILTIFLIRNQVTPAEIGFIFSVGGLIGLLLEVPSGAIADRIGRRNALTLTMLFQAASMAVFALGDSFSDFLLANALYWGGGSLLSGTHEALIYETLAELKREKELKRVVGRALFISQVVTGLLFVLVPLLAKVWLALPFWLNALEFLIGAAIAWTLTEPARAVRVQEQELGKDLLGFKTFFSNKSLLVGGLFFASVGGINAFLEDFRQAYLDLIHLDLAYFGLVYLALRIIVGFSGVWAEKLEKRWGRGPMYGLLVISNLATYLGLFFLNSLYGLLFIVLDGFQGGFSRPLEQDYLNSRINHANRATLLSVFNFMEGIIRAIVVFAGGLVVQTLGLQIGFGLAALLVVMIVIPLLFSTLRQGVKVSA